MKLSRTLTMTVLVVATVGAGAGTAVAAPNAAFDPLNPPVSTNSQVAATLFPGNNPKQIAFDTMTNEVNAGWNNGGLQSTLGGAAMGLGIGCVSIFPNFIAGCIVGGAIGTVVGAGQGIMNGNPNAAPAVQQFFATP
ncbi:hypothetical protein [Rhodococcus sp. OK302]|uniref:hypothetical protein n=1 Tax=Rhodococcus sp. OK302 TaxID=1882769 RepID=UPI000B9F4B9B|nr:hypothetical protein [Rhodococcus sp. OK302]OYD66917.1 hypothetical protein BDB13_0415 [Rhodococcus sp. OK302]